MSDAHGLEDVLLEVIVEAEPAHTLDQLACPVDVDAVLPGFARLVDQRLREIVVERARKLIEALCAGPVDQTLVKERVAEAG